MLENNLKMYCKKKYHYTKKEKIEFDEISL